MREISANTRVYCIIYVGLISIQKNKLKVTFTESMTVENSSPLRSTIGSKYDF